MPKDALRRIVSGIAGLACLGVAIFIWRNYLQHNEPVSGDVSSLSDTEIVIHPNVPLNPSKNVIWCGSMALAWNEAIALLKNPLIFTPTIFTADLLNHHDFTKSDLDPDSYVAMAGFKTESVDEKFRGELRQKFGDAANPPKLDVSDPPPTPGDVAIYAYLQKNLAFVTPFDINEPLSFDGRRVASFGFGFEKSHSNETRRELTSEVRLLNYKTKDDFVIQLKTKSPGDQLILAKTSPEKTLQETISRVLPSLNSTGTWGLDERDKVDIPKINFDLTKHFKEFENQPVPGGRLNTVAENVLFRLDENGAQLKVFATITGTLAVAANAQPLQLIFDKPFLVLLKRESSPRPYFAMWIGNPKLMLTP